MTGSNGDFAIVLFTRGWYCAYLGLCARVGFYNSLGLRASMALCAGSRARAGVFGEYPVHRLIP